MSQVIRISDTLYKRLEAHASGFDTPANVIERSLDSLEGIEPSERKGDGVSPTDEIQPARKLEIIYFPDSEEGFKKELLIRKLAFIRLHYTNGNSELKEWNASNFTSNSKLSANLRSGFLRDWKQKGIYKAELAINSSDIG